MIEATGFVTAGGRSSRMGRDKAWLELAGRTLIERVLAALDPVASRLAVIANDAEYLKLGFPVYKDRNPGAGPLAAVRTALEHSPTEIAILAGCDLPFVTSQLFAELLSKAGGYQAVVPLDPSGMEEPLCAVYARSALPAVVDLIEAARLKTSNLFGRVKTRFVHFEEIEQLAGSRNFFHNVNTMEDYGRALEIIRSVESDAISQK